MYVIRGHRGGARIEIVMYVIGTAGHIDHGKSALGNLSPRTKVRDIEPGAADFSPRGRPPR